MKQTAIVVNHTYTNEGTRDPSFLPFQHTHNEQAQWLLAPAGGHMELGAAPLCLRAHEAWNQAPLHHFYSP